MLEKIDKKKNPFKVPENYFESFNAGIMDKLPETTKTTAKIVPLWKKTLSWAAVAAVFCGVIFSTGILNKKSTTDKNAISSTGLASSLEDDYYMFLEDEVTKSQYRDMLFNN
ncbi:MAG: hypothetical protein QM660_01280 [Dysgonomonas sp.]